MNTAVEVPYVRAPQLPETIKSSTVQWLVALPLPVRPKHLPVKFVRIANRLADVWHDPNACSAYFLDLLLNRRGARSGFPNEVGIELATLQNYFETKVFALPQTVWDQIAGHRRDE